MYPVFVKNGVPTVNCVFGGQQIEHPNPII